jgi:hypothetical protein
VKAWRVEKEGAGQGGPGGPTGDDFGGPPASEDEPWPDGSSFDPASDEDDDLPF